MGFTGKLAIHPRQVEPIARIFTPTQSAIQRARQIIAANQAHQEAGKGVFVLDGKMMDAPDVRAAEIVLARAQATGIAVD
jgi:citrate lyase beta subunit